MKAIINYFKNRKKKISSLDFEISCAVEHLEAHDTEELLDLISNCKAKQSTPIVKIIAAVVFVN